MDSPPPSTGSKPEDLTPSLVCRLRAGDAQAGRQLDELYRAAIYRFCLGYLNDPNEAEDAIQEVFCRVLRTKDAPDSFRAWLYRVARNYCLSVLRARARHGRPQPLPSASLPGLEHSGLLTRLARREEQAQLVDLVNRLSPEHREILRLRYAEQLSRPEIAEVLETTVGVVKSRLFAGLKELRESADQRPSS